LPWELPGGRDDVSDLSFMFHVSGGRSPLWGDRGSIGREQEWPDPGQEDHTWPRRGRRPAAPSWRESSACSSPGLSPRSAPSAAIPGMTSSGTRKEEGEEEGGKVI